MNILAIVGSARSEGHTINACKSLFEKMKRLGEIEGEIISLSELNVKICRGCKLCFDRGDELCPLDDGFDTLLDKISRADGVVFASPNYSFHVSGHMKVFLDRMGFIFHRPRFFGKGFTSIVTQGIYGGSRIQRYFSFIGKALGFNVSKGAILRTLEPMTEKADKKNDKQLNKLAERFSKQLSKEKYPRPSMPDLMMFRFSRTSIRNKLDENYRDFNYYKEMGWFESSFFYPVKLNPLMLAAGAFCDFLAEKI